MPKRESSSLHHSLDNATTSASSNATGANNNNNEDNLTYSESSLALAAVASSLISLAVGFFVGVFVARICCSGQNSDSLRPRQQAAGSKFGGVENSALEIGAAEGEHQRQKHIQSISSTDTQEKALMQK